MPKRTDVSSILIIGLCLLGFSTMTGAAPPPEPADWVAQLPAGAWVFGARPWEDQGGCDAQVCNAALNAAPYLVNVRLPYHSGPQISFHGSVAGCPSTFQRLLRDVTLDSPGDRQRFEQQLALLVSDMKRVCNLREDARLPPLSIEMLQAGRTPEPRVGGLTRSDAEEFSRLAEEVAREAEAEMSPSERRVLHARVEARVRQDLNSLAARCGTSIHLSDAPRFEDSIVTIDSGASPEQVACVQRRAPLIRPAAEPGSEGPR